MAKLGVPLTALSTRLSTDYPSGTYYIILLRDTGTAGRSVYTLATSNVNTTDDEITVTGANFLVDTPVKFQGADPPAPFTTTATYWIKTKTGDVYTFAATKGGAELAIDDQGSGTFTIQDEELDFAIDPNPAIAQIVRKEINYQGITNRPTFTPPGSITLDPTNNQAYFPVSVALDNTGSGSLVEFDKIAVIASGSATPGNTTGTLKRLLPLGGIGQVEGGKSRDLNFTIAEANRNT